MPETDLGKVCPTPRGEWKEDTRDYTTLDIVSYKGESYIVLKNVIGIPPTNDNVNYMQIAEKGPSGTDATIRIGTVTTGQAGTNAEIVNSGTDTTAVLDFTIPKGDKGDSGQAATLRIGEVLTGENDVSAAVSNSGNEKDAILNFLIPKGKDGEDGVSATLQIGSVATGTSDSPVKIENVGTDRDAVWNISIPRGKNGTDGTAASIGIGTVTTGTPDTKAAVSNSGTENAAILNFIIPRGGKGDPGDPGKDGTSVNIQDELDSISDLPATGLPGDGYIIDGFLYVWKPITKSFVNVGKIQGPTGKPGPDGKAATITIGTVTTGTNANVANAGNETDAILDFTIPKGDKGDSGQAATIRIGNVTAGAAGSDPSVSNSGNGTEAVLDFVIPRGSKGNDGKSASIQVGQVNTGEPGTNVTVVNSGTATDAKLDFTIPRGAKGEAATIEAGTVTIVDENTPASVTNSGDVNRARFDFKIPVPKIPAPAKWVKFTPADPRLSTEADDLYYKIKEDCIYLISRDGGCIFVQNNGAGYYKLISCSDLGLTNEEAFLCSSVKLDNSELVFHDGYFCLRIDENIEEITGFYTTTIILRF